MRQPIAWALALCMCLAPSLGGCVTAVDGHLPYAQLPEITVASPLVLVASPSHPVSGLSVPVSAGERLQVIGADENTGWLLVLRGNTLGWMPSFYSRTPVGTLQPALVITSLPAACTAFVGAIDDPSHGWVSSSDAVIILGSIYRPRGKAPLQDATLAVEVDGRAVSAKGDYIHTPLTPYSALILFAFSVDGLRAGSKVRVNLANPRGEPVSFQAALFSNDCPGGWPASGATTVDRLPIGVLKATASEQVSIPQSNASPGSLPTPAYSYTPLPAPTPVIIVVRSRSGHGSRTSQGILPAAISLGSGQACGTVGQIDTQGAPYTVNVREGPSTAYSARTTVKHGDQVAILGCNEARDWWLIRTPGGQQGWVFAQYVRPSCRNRCSAGSSQPTSTGGSTVTFDASPRTISCGSCSTLSWAVDGVQEVYLDGAGVIGHDSRRVCPAQTRTYVLTVVARDGTRHEHRVTLNVTGTCSERFQQIDRGCTGSGQGVGVLKGRVLDRSGNPIQGVVLHVRIVGAAGERYENVVPPAVSDHTGWYVWFLGSGQMAEIHRLELNGRSVPFEPTGVLARLRANCLYHIDFQLR
ncbi:MAG: SH3 domain-containing protein [Anaerolineae bacterium]|nr:SH3 domain-containing protein [Anaerolineae bacterium]